MNQDRCCTLNPYFKIHDGQRDPFRDLCKQFIEKTGQEANCLYYGFSFDGDEAHSREAYDDAEGLLAHLVNLSGLISKALQIADLARLEVHGPKEKLAKLRVPLAELNLNSSC